jgi:hypothetical protein
MSETESVTKIGDITSITGGELHTGITRRASASGSPQQDLGRPGAHPGVTQIVDSAGRICNRETLSRVVLSVRTKTLDRVIRVVLSVRGRTSERAPVNKAEGAKWPPVANEAAAVAAPLTDQEVGISSEGQVNAGRPAGVQAPEAAADAGEVEAVAEEDVEGNE